MDKPIEISGRSVEVWPKQQLLYSLGSPKLIKTSFADIDVYHPGLMKRIQELAAEPAPPIGTGKFVCGRKIHDPECWKCPEAELISARAMALFRRITNSPTADVDNSWATIYESGDFCLPHSHLRAAASIVYMLDPGDENPRWKGNGRLGFADPRLEVCCPEEPGHVTSPQFPEFDPGDMLMFPGELIHLVCPYEGERPRITLSWNINRHPLPGAREHHIARRQALAEAMTDATS